MDVIERFLLDELFPNPGPTKVWVEKYLGCEDNNLYNNCSGITELRLLTKKQRNWVLVNLYNLRDGKPVHGAFKPLQDKLASI